jgi:hypothetical protein
MTKNYQTKTTRAAMSAEVVIPDRVSVAMADLAGAMREGLLALAVGAGLQVMQALMDKSVTALAGPKGRHDPTRSCRHKPLPSGWAGSHQESHQEIRRVAGFTEFHLDGPDTRDLGERVCAGLHASLR